ncbi:MAG: hypothetical protein HQM09_13710 [Candidatus Riflebacteria bacterium]|nr:hypothetical protein [Candidatus Riflebacteria bacterium]
MSITGSNSVPKDDQIISIPRNLLSGVFNQVSYRKDGQEVEVFFQFLIPPADDWNTVVAIDSSESMRPLFGKSLIGDIPLSVQERYHRQNLVIEETRDGCSLLLYKPEAYEDAVANGFLKWTDNEIEPKAREIIDFLGTHIDARKSCNLMYWGCEKKPGWVDTGEIKIEDCNRVTISGPDTFGTDSRLLPILKYLVGRLSVVKRSMVVILTDGLFSDAEDVKTYCSNLAILIKAKERNFMKLVLIGIGKNIDKKAMASFNDMKIGPTTELWDCRMAEDISEMSEIFVGDISDEKILAPRAVVFDSKGNVVKEFPDGLPAKGSFRMPIEETSFTFQIFPSNKKIQQSLLMSFRKSLI